MWSGLDRIVRGLLGCCFVWGCAVVIGPRGLRAGSKPPTVKSPLGGSTFVLLFLSNLAGALFGKVELVFF